MGRYRLGAGRSRPLNFFSVYVLKSQSTSVKFIQDKTGHVTNKIMNVVYMEICSSLLLNLSCFCCCLNSFQYENYIIVFYRSTPTGFNRVIYKDLVAHNIYLRFLTQPKQVKKSKGIYLAHNPNCPLLTTHFTPKLSSPNCLYQLPT